MADEEIEFLRQQEEKAEAETYSKLDPTSSAMSSIDTSPLLVNDSTPVIDDAQVVTSGNDFHNSSIVAILSVAPSEDVSFLQLPIAAVPLTAPAGVATSSAAPVKANTQVQESSTYATLSAVNATLLPGS